MYTIAGNKRSIQHKGTVQNWETYEWGKATVRDLQELGSLMGVPLKLLDSNDRDVLIKVLARPALMVELRVKELDAETKRMQDEIELRNKEVDLRNRKAAQQATKLAARRVVDADAGDLAARVGVMRLAAR